MKNHILAFALVIAPLFFHAPTVNAQVSLKAEWASSYIWRGFDLNPVEKPVFQPSLTYSFNESGLSAELWTSFSFEDRELHEIDFTLMIERSIGELLAIEAGFIHYGWYFTPDFSFRDDTSHEIYLSTGLPDILLSPYLTAFYDFTNGDGLYVLAETEHTWNPLPPLGVLLYASLGYNGGQWLEKGADPGFSDLNFRASLPISIGRFRVIPYAQYTFVLLDAVGTDDFFCYGISVSIGEE